MKKIIIILISLGVIVILISFSSAHNWFYNSPSLKGSNFEKNETLVNSDFTQEKFDKISEYIDANSQTTSMVVLQNGKIIYEYGDVSEISYIASCRKSVLSLLYGKYVQNGTINLQQKIGEMGIDEDDGLLAVEKQATIDNIITSRSGVFHLPANGGYDEKNIKERGSVKPGEYFVYNNWDFNVGGFILEGKSGNSIYEEIEKQIAIPTGFQDWNVENQKRTINEDNSRYSAYHIHISTRDMAKLGQLMLNKGKWNNKQIVPTDWIEKITTTVTPRDTINKRDRLDSSSPVQFSYGYMWWLFERFYDNPDFEGAYTASGYGGQFITVIPKRNVVIAHKTEMDLLTIAGLSERSMTPSWRYYHILAKLMENRKDIEELAKAHSTDKMVELIKNEQNIKAEYNISQGAIQKYGQKLMNSRNFEDAIKCFKLITEIYPIGYYTSAVFENYGKCLMELELTERAIEMYKKALELDSESKEAKKIISKFYNQ